MKKSIKTIAFAFLAIVFLVSVSSCNRSGYGCPYELKAPISLFSR